MNTTIGQKLQAYKDKHFKPVLYNRNKAYRLLGFKNSKSLTDWLRGNSFIRYNDNPDYFFIEKGLMEVKITHVGRSRPMDDYGIVKGGSEYDDPFDTVKTIYTPLFTEKGIEYFKELLSDPAKLQKEVEEIKSLTQYDCIPFI